MVTHDQDEAMGLSTKVVMLDKGRVQQQGAPRDVILNPANRFVAGCLGAETLGAGRAATHDGRFGARFVERLPCSSSGLVEGAQVEVLVHADSVAVTPPDANPPTNDHATTVGGVVERIEVVGRSTRCIVRIGAVTLPSMIPARSALELREGDPVLVTVDAYGVDASAIDETKRLAIGSQPLSGAVTAG